MPSFKSKKNINLPFKTSLQGGQSDSKKNVRKTFFRQSTFVNKNSNNDIEEEDLIKETKLEKKEKSKYQMYFTKLTAEKSMEFFEKKNKNNVILYFDNKVKDGKITYDNLSEDIKEFNTQIEPEALELFKTKAFLIW